MNNTFDRYCLKCSHNAGDKYGKLYCDIRGKLKVKELKIETDCKDKLIEENV